MALSVISPAKESMRSPIRSRKELEDSGIRSTLLAMPVVLIWKMS